MHELKKLAHELFELRDTHLKEIQQLKEHATTSPASNEMSMSQIFPGGDVAAARDQNAVLQVRASSLTANSDQLVILTSQQGSERLGLEICCEGRTG